MLNETTKKNFKLSHQSTNYNQLIIKKISIKAQKLLIKFFYPKYKYLHLETTIRAKNFREHLFLPCLIHMKIRC